VLLPYVHVKFPMVSVLVLPFEFTNVPVTSVTLALPVRPVIWKPTSAIACEMFQLPLLGNAEVSVNVTWMVLLVIEASKVPETGSPETGLVPEKVHMVSAEALFTAKVKTNARASPIFDQYGRLRTNGCMWTRFKRIKYMFMFIIGHGGSIASYVETFVSPNYNSRLVDMRISRLSQQKILLCEKRPEPWDVSGHAAGAGSSWFSEEFVQLHYLAVSFDFWRIHAERWIGRQPIKGGSASDCG
jgi:hypothetical protein